MKRRIKKSNNLALLSLFLILGTAALVVPFLVYGQSSSEKRAELEAQIAAIEAEIASLDGELTDVQQRKLTLENEVFRLNTEIKKTELSIQGLNLSISDTENKIDEKQVNIDTTQADIEKQKSSIAEYLRVLYKYNDRSLVEILLSKDLSEFFQEVSVLEGLQEDAQVSLTKLKSLKSSLESEKVELGERREELSGLKALEEIQKQNLSSQKGTKNNLLSVTKGEEAAFQKVISEKKRDIAAIRSQIFYLERTGVTAEEAVKFAELASIRTGIRTAFLLGLLEVETGRRFNEGVITAGSNLGSGNWREDMHPRDHQAYLDITEKLGLDPDAMPVSAKPSYGWGGAIGPAQFLPSTWLIFEDRVAKLTGHDPPNPWIIEDAFTAAALYLADAGATSQTRVGEIRAAKAYISGNPNCTRYICNFYSSEVLRVADLIDQNL